MLLMLWGLNVSALVGSRVCMHVCVLMLVSVTTHTQGMYKISLYTFRLLSARCVSWLCVCPGSPVLAYVPACRVCEITSLTSADLLTLFISFYTWPPLIETSREGRCARTSPSRLENIAVSSLPQVLLWAGGGSWFLTSIFSSPAGVMAGESPNEVYEPIKQAFNLLVYAQESC